MWSTARKEEVLRTHGYYLTEQGQPPVLAGTLHKACIYRLKKAKPIYDAGVDGREGDYADYCFRLGIPGGYANTVDFCKRYFFDRNNPNSLASSLVYAYDNAVVLRDTLTTDTLSYIQLAMNAAATVLESTLAHSLNVIGTHCLVVEMGVGMRLTKSYGEQLVDGILNLMHTQGMWAGETKPPRKPIVSKDEVAFKVIRRLHGGCL